jgi:Cu(I)-responsive transcriptional regulator
MNIGEASAASGVSAKMIRYYEETGLIPAVRRSDAGYRTYGHREVQMLRFIRRARDLGFSVHEIVELLALWRDQSRHSADVKQLAAVHIADLRGKIAAMQGMVATLQTLADSCAGDQRADCPILKDLERSDAASPPGRKSSGFGARMPG